MPVFLFSVFFFPLSTKDKLKSKEHIQCLSQMSPPILDHETDLTAVCNRCLTSLT